MKTNPNDSANGFAIPGDEKAGWLPETVSGLTKRESFEMAAMQGYITSNPTVLYDINELAHLSNWSVVTANALIKALNEEQNEEATPK